MDCPRCGSENVHWEIVEEIEGKGFVWEAECKEKECDWQDTKYVF